ncbi:MAG: hypothetical protein R2723_08400 [Microbacterium sp.]
MRCAGERQVNACGGTAARRASSLSSGSRGDVKVGTMAKTTTGKAQRHAREAIDEASTALARAKKATASLSAKQARRLDDYVGDARSAVDVSKKKIARKPRKVAHDAERAAGRLERAVAKAVARAERKARLRESARRAAADAERAEREAAERAAEAKALRKAARRAQKEAARAELDSQAADEALVAELTSSGAVEAAGPVEAARDAPVAEEPVAASERTDLAALTVVELRARARAEGRTGYSRLTKSQLIDLLS